MKCVEQETERAALRKEVEGLAAAKSQHEKEAEHLRRCLSRALAEEKNRQQVYDETAGKLRARE